MDESHRFRQALKNPMVALALCLIAGFAVYDNLGLDLFDAPESTPREGEQFSSPSGLASVINGRPENHLEVQWIDDPERDPFAPITTAAAPLSEPLPSSPSRSAMEPPQVQDELVLKAISVDGRQRSAVINRTVLYEGETINAFRILSIQPKGVWLKNGNKTRWLTFSKKTALALASN